jgi:hypothetical protein
MFIGIFWTSKVLLLTVTEFDADGLAEAVDVVASAFLRGKSSERALAMYARSTSKGVKNCIAAVQRRLFLVGNMDGCLRLVTRGQWGKKLELEGKFLENYMVCIRSPLLSRFPRAIVPTPADVVLHLISLTQI